MNIALDFILPPIIVAMLIGMIFSSNALILESTVESRVNNDLQFTAGDLITVIQEEVRGIREVVDLQDNHFRFVNHEQDTVTIYQSGREMILQKASPAGTVFEPESYAGRLAELKFEAPGAGGGLSPTLLRVSVITESTPAQEVRERAVRMKAVAQRDIYLRNLHLAGSN